VIRIPRPSNVSIDVGNGTARAYLVPLVLELGLPSTDNHRDGSGQPGNLADGPVPLDLQGNLSVLSLRSTCFAVFWELRRTIELEQEVLPGRVQAGHVLPLLL
jgi:hypothetical protein